MTLVVEGVSEKRRIAIHSKGKGGNHVTAVLCCP